MGDAPSTATISGTTGTVRFGYHAAVTLGPWQITIADGATQIDAAIAAVNRAWLGEAPLDLCVEIGGVEEWIWRDVRPVIEGDRVRVLLMGRPAIVRLAPA